MKTKVTLPGINLSDEEEAIRVDAFWEELQGYSIELVEEVFRWARGSLVFFPKPVELTDHLAQEARLRYQSKREELESIEWMEPTEQGRALAVKIMSDLKEKWKKEDLEIEAKRGVAFEKNREKLRKQAKQLLKDSEYRKGSWRK